MKNEILDQVRKNKRKVFTKRTSNSKIKKNYNPLKVNCKIYKRKGGLYRMEKEILEEIKKDLDFKERIIVHINKKTFLKVFNKTRTDTINKLIK